MKKKKLESKLSKTKKKLAKAESRLTELESQIAKSKKPAGATEPVRTLAKTKKARKPAPVKKVVAKPLSTSTDGVRAKTAP